MNFTDAWNPMPGQPLQAWLQDLLEQEVTGVLGRRKHDRKRPGGDQAGGSQWA